MSASAQTTSANRRAAALADRIEQGADLLAAFAEQLSDAEWAMPVTTTDRRTIGVIVHHVASVYPLEVQAAQTISRGSAMMEVTPEAIAELNANHSRENQARSKAETIKLLRRNSREAAAAVREFTDEQLDQAAPFGLSFGAPVTAQFVIEDHAVRHSWHHLARIRKAVKR